MTFESPEQRISDIQHEILKVSENINTAELKKYELKKELVDIMETIRKGEYLLSKLKIEEKIATREFWANKNR